VAFCVCGTSPSWVDIFESVNSSIRKFFLFDQHYSKITEASLKISLQEAFPRSLKANCMDHCTRKNIDFAPMAKSQSPDFSFDTDSTASTSNSSADVDVSFERASLFGKSYDGDLESPSNINQRGTPLFHVFDDAWNEGSTSKDHRRTCHNRNSKALKARRINVRQCQRIGLFATVTAIILIIITPGAVPTAQRMLKLHQWKTAFKTEAKGILKEIRGSQMGETFTVVLRGQQLDLLKRAVDAISHCSAVREIQIDYQRNGSAFPEYLHRYGGGKVAYKGHISTSAAFLADEALLYSCQDLQTAFNIWKQDPKRLVRFHGDGSGVESDLSWKPSYNANTVTPNHYSLSAFIHRRYLVMAAPVMTPEACGDRLLALQVAAISKTVPIFVKASPQIFRQPSKVGPKNSPADADHLSEQCVHHLERLESLPRVPSLLMLEATSVLGLPTLPRAQMTPQ
jgi:Glycosyl transferase family 64 domain